MKDNFGILGALRSKYGNGVCEELASHAPLKNEKKNDNKSRVFSTNPNCSSWHTIQHTTR